MTHLAGQTAFITGASLGIGAALAKQLYANGANVYLLARSTDKLRALADELKQSHPNSPAKIAFSSDGDVTDFDKVYTAVDDCIAQLGSISILVNNAGIALAAPRPFWEQSRDEIESMEAVNIRGLYNATHAVLNRSMIPSNKGTILNISSITGDNAPTFRGEACYHSHKKHMNGFSDVLRHELVGTDIKVLVLKPGCVKQTNFHPQRVGYSKELAEDFFAGYDQLTPEEVADGAVKMLDTSVKVSITSMTILPTPQRGYVNDTEWNARHSVE